MANPLPHEPVTPACRTCRFRLPDPPTRHAGNGYCVRFPPQFVAVPQYNASGDLQQRWPWMQSTDWCGEYSPTPPGDQP